MKRTLLLLLTLVLFVTSVNGQSIICGTTPNSSYVPNTSASSASFTWVNVYYHIVRKSNGTGGLPTSQLCSVTNYLNDTFNRYGIFFNVTGNGFVDNDSYYDVSNSAASLLSTNSQSNAINVYFVNSSQQGLGGCAAGIPSAAFFVTNDAVTSSVISHEMGHCFGLFHTHRGTNVGTFNETGSGICTENVDGTNCASCGDRICDTPADPNVVFNNQNCSYTGTAQQNGLNYNPDVQNIMSYAADGCRIRFSPMQVNAMTNQLNQTGGARNTSLPTATISGANLVCQSANFSVSGVRSGFWVENWSSSNTAIATVNSSGQVQRVGDGSVTVSVSLTNGCYHYTVHKTTYVGNPVAVGGTYSYGIYTYPVNNPSIGIGVSGANPYISFNLTQTDPSASFSWNVASSSGNSWFTPNGNTGTAYVGSGASITITCRSVNSCGNGPLTTFNCYNYSYRMVAAPNPAHQTMTVKAVLIEDDDQQRELAATEKLLYTQDTNNIPVRLLDKDGNVVASGKLADHSVVFNVEKLPDGFYYLHTAEGEQLIRQQVVIQHK